MPDPSKHVYKKCYKDTPILDIKSYWLKDTSFIYYHLLPSITHAWPLVQIFFLRLSAYLLYICSGPYIVLIDFSQSLEMASTTASNTSLYPSGNSSASLHFPTPWYPPSASTLNRRQRPNCIYTTSISLEDVSHPIFSLYTQPCESPLAPNSPGQPNGNEAGTSIVEPTVSFPPGGGQLGTPSTTLVVGAAASGQSGHSAGSAQSWISVPWHIAVIIVLAVASIIAIFCCLICTIRRRPSHKKGRTSSVNEIELTNIRPPAAQREPQKPEEKHTKPSQHQPKTLLPREKPRKPAATTHLSQKAGKAIKNDIQSGGIRVTNNENHHHHHHHHHDSGYESPHCSKPRPRRSPTSNPLRRKPTPPELPGSPEFPTYAQVSERFRTMVPPRPPSARRGSYVREREEEEEVEVEEEEGGRPAVVPGAWPRWSPQRR